MAQIAYLATTTRSRVKLVPHKIRKKIMVYLVYQTN